MRKITVKILSAFIPVQSWRKAFREKFWELLGVRSWKSVSYAISNEMVFDVNRRSFWDRFNAGVWEPETHAFYKKYVNPAKEIIDIGGWIGPTMLIAYSYNPKKIHVVEADPANYQILKMNCRKNFLEDKVELHNLCISDKTGEIRSFGYTDESNSDTSTKSLGGQRVKVLTVSFLDFLKSRDLSNVNIIKIDIEGAEILIAEGLDYISRFPGIHVLLSIHTPFWADKKVASNILMKQFHKFQVFSDKEEPIELAALETMMLAETSCSWKNKTGLFFTLILKTLP